MAPLLHTSCNVCSHNVHLLPHAGGLKYWYVYSKAHDYAQLAQPHYLRKGLTNLLQFLMMFSSASVLDGGPARLMEGLDTPACRDGVLFVSLPPKLAQHKIPLHCPSDFLQSSQPHLR